MAAKWGVDGLTRAMALDGRDHGVAGVGAAPGLHRDRVRAGRGRRGSGAWRWTRDDIARILFLMASLPDEQNLLEAVTLPLGMPSFLGRGGFGPAGTPGRSGGSACLILRVSSPAARWISSPSRRP
ncbi:MAG: hypothetical protein WDM92_11575 [Caulobacteraceae bacterium]